MSILIDPPDGSTVLAARHLDATEGPVQVGGTVDTATRSAISTALAYIARAHNSPAAPDLEAAVGRVRDLCERGVSEDCADNDDTASGYRCALSDVGAALDGEKSDG